MGTGVNVYTHVHRKITKKNPNQTAYWMIEASPLTQTGWSMREVTRMTAIHAAVHLRPTS